MEQERKEMRNRVFRKGWYYIGLLSDRDFFRMMYGFCSSVGKDPSCKRFIDTFWPQKRKRSVDAYKTDW